MISLRDMGVEGVRSGPFGSVESECEFHRRLAGEFAVMVRMGNENKILVCPHITGTN